MDGRNNLTPLQRRFVEEYVYGEHRYNALASAKAAGYSESNRRAGFDALRHPAVAAEIARLCIARQAKWNIEQNDLRDALATIAFDPREANEGGPTRGERMEAIDKLCKMHGFYAPEKHLHGHASFAELLALAKQIEAGMPPALPPERLRIANSAA